MELRARPDAALAERARPVRELLAAEEEAHALRGRALEQLRGALGLEVLHRGPRPQLHLHALPARAHRLDKNSKVRRAAAARRAALLSLHVGPRGPRAWAAGGRAAERRSGGGRPCPARSVPAAPRLLCKYARERRGARARALCQARRAGPDDAGADPAGDTEQARWQGRKGASPGHSARVAGSALNGALRGRWRAKRARLAFGYPGRESVRRGAAHGERVFEKCRRAIPKPFTGSRGALSHLYRVEVAGYARTRVRGGRRAPGWAARPAGSLSAAQCQSRGAKLKAGSTLTPCNFKVLEAPGALPAILCARGRLTVFP